MKKIIDCKNNIEKFLQKELEVLENKEVFYMYQNEMCIGEITGLYVKSEINAIGADCDTNLEIEIYSKENGVVWRRDSDIAFSKEELIENISKNI